MRAALTAGRPILGATPSRIATVLAPDAAGYSWAVSLDEGRALAARAASRRIIDRLVAAGEFSSALFIAMRPFRFPADREPLLDGLRLGGLPE